MEQTSEIQISVIMPVYNAQSYVEQAVESVRKQEMIWELLIIDDCSTDDTGKILMKYQNDARIKVIKNAKNSGAAESRNAGIRMARGKYIAFLDADDWWADGKLKLQYEMLEQCQAVLCCTGRVSIQSRLFASGLSPICCHSDHKILADATLVR